MDMEAKLLDKIYRDIIINIEEFTQIRFFRNDHVQEVDPTSKEDKNTIHPWPNQYAINRFHRKNKEQLVEELNYYNIEVLDNQYMFYFLLNHEDYKKYVPEDTIDYERFLYLYHYYIIQRLIHWAKENIKVDITLQYKELFPNELMKPLIISNTPLIDYLMRQDNRDELVWRIQVRDDPSKFLNIHYTMTDLIFRELQLYFDTKFTIRKTEGKKLNFKDKGYALVSDKNTYEEIANHSYINFIQLREDKPLISNIKEHFEKYRIDPYI